ncbi:penicillin-binding protein 2 [Candidatus Uhrbacteria bacterium]|nr:penicillin-binding protein 2 [Candidatus Uhrbacteria bacterium]
MRRFGIRRMPDPFAGRMVFLRVILAVSAAVLAGRLFHIQVISHSFYSALASDQHDIFRELFPERGGVFLADPDSPDGRFPVAVNKTMYTAYADTRKMEPADREAAVRALSPILGIDEPVLDGKLGVEDDPYVPLKSRLDEDTVERLRSLKVRGIAFSPQSFRFYPESETACHLTGFVGSDEGGNLVGRYGVEGYWNTELSGQAGYLDSRGNSTDGVAVGGSGFRPAQDGADIVLTVDRSIQFVACSKLREAVIGFQAVGGSVVVMEPDTGRLLAVCGYPDFDPNDYSSVRDMSVFNNPATYHAYEPGSVMKPLTMAAAIDAGKVSPNTTYEDTGQVKIGPYTISNSDGKANGRQTMTQVLEKSLNTGAIFAVRELGPDRFLEYVEAFGFGQPTGVEIAAETAGDISSLRKRGDIWSTTGSYGQGITATPIQLVAAFGALANGGRLMRPHVVSEVRYPDGTGNRIEPQSVRQVVSKRTADMVSGMLVQVVENGHGKRAGVPGYWVAGKTGTAQMARADGGGYDKDRFIGTFVGFAPVDDPAFVMLVKIESPQGVSFAESTAAPLFGELASFLLQYIKIPPDRPY